MFDAQRSQLSRAADYNSTFGERYPGSILTLTDNFIHGVWLLGNDYQGSGFYGAYPPAYLKRISTLFQEPGMRVLHLFSGSLPKSRLYTRFDLIYKADIKGNAEELSRFFKPKSFDVIYADTPYSKAAAARYGTPLPHRRLVLEECARILVRGGFVVWLDTVWPMISKTKLQLVGTIAILRSSNHVVRAVFLFRKPL